MKTRYLRIVVLATLSLSALFANSFGLEDPRVLRPGGNSAIQRGATSGVPYSNLENPQTSQSIAPYTLPKVSPRSDQSLTFPAPSDDFGSASLKIARRGHTTTALTDGRVVFIGGENQHGLVDATEILDAGSRLTAVKAKLITPRSRHTATPLPDGRVLVAGGWDHQHLLDSSEIFDPATNSFLPGPRLLQARAAHNATVLQDGRILITGGVPDATAEVVDPITNTSTGLNARMTAARSFHGAIVLNDANVLLVGGVDPDGHPLCSAEIFDTRTLRFLPTINSMNLSRVRPTLRLLGDGKVQIIGGDYDGTMEIYDGRKGVFAAPAHLVPTLDIFSASNVICSQTRAAFIDNEPQPEGNANIKGAKAIQSYSSTVRNALEGFDYLLDRVDYSATEIPYSNQSVIAGGANRKGVYLRSVIMIKSSPASITTGEVEYGAGEHVLISGAGFQPNEAIRIVRQEARPTHRRTFLKAVADENGDFIDSDIPLADFEAGMTYTLTAMGEASMNVAQTVYKYALPLDPEAQTKPKESKISIPLLFRDASFELEDGILIWRVVSGLEPQVKPPEMSLQSVSASYTFKFSEIKGKPCLGSSFCPAGLDIRMRDESFLTVGGGLDASIGSSGAKITVDENVSGNLTFDVRALGTIRPPTIPIPFASVVFRLNFGPFTAKVTIGVVAKVEITAESPGTTIVAGSKFSEHAKIGLGFGRSGITPIAEQHGSSFVPVFNLVETGGGCIRISIGPQFEIEAGINLFVCRVGVRASLFIGSFIEVCLNLSGPDNCRRYDVPLSVGAEDAVEGSADFCFFGTNGSSSSELFRDQITSFASGIWRDTDPPVITCPANVIQSNDPGLCSAVVNYPTAVAVDSCSGVRSVDCAPPSGSQFPIGVTNVVCTALDNLINVSTCTFTVTVEKRQNPAPPCGQQFDVCLQDDSSGNFLRLNSTTGAYQVTNCALRGGFTLTGVGTVRIRGSVISLEHYTIDRRVVAQIDNSSNRGSASVAVLPLEVVITISDRNTANNSCTCSVAGQQPDLVPEPTSAFGFCRRDAQGRLIVRVKNQGNDFAAPFMVEVRFEVGSGLPPVSILLRTAGLFPGESRDLDPIAFPANCFNSDCHFTINVDPDNRVQESNEGNNLVAGTCPG